MSAEKSRFLRYKWIIPITIITLFSILFIKMFLVGIDTKYVLIGGVVPFVYSIDFINTLALSIIILVTPISILVYLDVRRKKMVEYNMARFLLDLSESVRTGLTLLNALDDVSHRDYGPLTKIIKRIVMKVNVGTDLEEAIESEIKDQSKNTKRLFSMVAEAYVSGGRASMVLREASRFALMLQMFEEERSRNLKVYVWIAYMSILVFLATSAILVYLTLTIYESAQGPTAIFLKGFLPPDIVAALLYYTGILISLFSGIIIGKVLGGKVVYGVTHMLILIIINILFFNNIGLVVTIMPMF